MAYQQQQILCQPNAWTQISETRPTRKSLMVQCPQVATVFGQTAVAAPQAGGVVQLIAANALRKSLVLSAISSSAFTVVWPVTVGQNSAGIALNYGGTTVPPPPLVVADEWGGMAGQAWQAQNLGASNDSVRVLSETDQCRAIILATNQAAAVPGGPYGNAPPGNWLSSDLSAGPANFRLQEALDADLVYQEWYAWPIGSVAVNVTVSEAWEVVIPSETPKKFTVALPRLSPDAIAALNDLLSRMDQMDED